MLSKINTISVAKNIQQFGLLLYIFQKTAQSNQSPNLVTLVGAVRKP
jgi:hypothetical protein